MATIESTVERVPAAARPGDRTFGAAVLFLWGLSFAAGLHVFGTLRWKPDTADGIAAVGLLALVLVVLCAAYNPRPRGG